MNKFLPLTKVLGGNFYTVSDGERMISRLLPIDGISMIHQASDHSVIKMKGFLGPSFKVRNSPERILEELHGAPELTG